MPTRMSNKEKVLKSQAMKVLADGKVMKVQKTRQRKILSCIYCHSKKIKCSRVQPVCNNCDKLGLECQYFVNERVSRGGKKSSRGSISGCDSGSSSKHGSQSVAPADDKKEHKEPGKTARNNSLSSTSEDGSSISPMSNANSLDESITTNDDIVLNKQDPHLSEIYMGLTIPGSRKAGSSNDNQLQSNTGIRNAKREHESRNTHSDNHSSLHRQNSMMSEQQHQEEQQRRIQAAHDSHQVHKHFSKVYHDQAGSPGYGGYNESALDCNGNIDDTTTPDAAHLGNVANGQSGDHDIPGSLSNSLLQTPVLNTVSNNITNNFFNTNYTAVNNEDPFDMNQYQFQNEQVLNGPEISNIIQNGQKSVLGKSNYLQTISNFIDSQPPTNAGNSTNNGAAGGRGANIHVSGAIEINAATPGTMSSVNQASSPGLHNSLTAYSSNPATTVNYLYGTNTNYDNVRLIDELINHLPQTKERSYELIDRYINSVHILLPIVVNLNDFVAEHDKYWNFHNPRQTEDMGSSSPSSAGSPGTSDFKYLQFYTLYFPILYASTISEFEEYDNLLLNQDISKYLQGFNKICQYYNYPHGLKSISLLLGNVIIQSTSPNPSTMEMSQIIRYAKLLQLHKDPQVSLGINDWEVVKFRRLLWWTIFGLDALTSHNFCLPPVCKFDDFNVLLPDEEDPVFDESGKVTMKKLNISILSINVKFKFDRILSELVYHLHNGLSKNITSEEIDQIKGMIVELYHDIHHTITKMNDFCKFYPPQTVQEMNVINFVKNHSWSFVDRSMMLLHKKILMRESPKGFASSSDAKSAEAFVKKFHSESLVHPRSNSLSFNQFEDTFGRLSESNIISNFDNSSISQLKFNQHKSFSYENLNDNLIPSILHNLNDFLKYNDFIKFGKYNWYVKRTIPLDSIILMFIIIVVKLKYEFMTVNELAIYVKLINKALFILNRKWFKNEKYKRMLSLTNMTWKYIMIKYNIIDLINQFYPLNIKNENQKAKIDFIDYQVSGYVNMNELFNVMNVPQPLPPDCAAIEKQTQSLYLDTPSENDFGKSTSEGSPTNLHFFQNVLITKEQFQGAAKDQGKIASNNQVANFSDGELMQLSEKIYYDLRNNYVDINDYCAFYSSLENILHELMDYIHIS
ncbi:Piso0_000063 [Millerozyma farinosa CBS 7064]|uniref:Piso0_000063 protein n=1 Tax=Pichia sorbitophila (strain ATCC MYA-4447 / BCRC 22081 / CBS 7064 / NBRC 10061 / NRRL Y-12695) TaxID=559304 RepID=G8YUF4_PICSO|nr:Piso0_000063 [Millerozyma farinosa CBS 7064]